MTKVLKDWYLQSSTPPEADPFKAPELQKPIVRLAGNVYGHPDFNDGDNITTSQIEELTVTDGVVSIRTVSGSVYQIEEPLNMYEDMYPNAKQRLIDQFTKKAMP